MTLQASNAVRSAGLDAMETATGASPILKIYDLTAGAPANCAAAITGTILATLNLPADAWAAAVNGVKALNAPWTDGAADAAGTSDFFRIFANDGTTCHWQGTITSTAVGTGDMLMDNPVLAVGQAVTVNTFTLTMGGA
jgi:hypothetical protein